MKKNILIVLGIIIFVVAVQLLFSNLSVFESLELKLYDLRSAIAGDNGIFGGKFNHADKDIVIVAIDDYSKKQLLENPPEEFGSWPWHRDVWINVVDFIEQGKPTAVMFDMVFEGLSENSWDDRRLAKELNKYDNIVLGNYLDNPKMADTSFTQSIEIDKNDYLPTLRPLNVTIDNKKLDDAITYYVNGPVHELYTNNNTIGIVNKILDKDSSVRRTQPIFKLVKDGETYYMPSLSFAGFMKYMGEDGDIVIKDNKINYKGRVIPIDNNGITNVNWHKLNHNYSYIPISKILLNKGGDKDIKPEYFKDKLVIIGKTEMGGKVDLSSIIDPSYATPEANAVALDNFMNDSDLRDKKARKFLSQIPKPVQFLITIAVCALVAVIGLVSKSALLGCINGFFLILVYVFFSFWLFANPSSRIMLPIALPLYYLAVTSGIVFAFRFHKEMTRKSSIINGFGKFLSPKILAAVLNDPNAVVMKNTKKKIAVLFCDVKDFSSLSEKYNPEKLMVNLNELLKEIVNIVFENNGTVDKFVGDGIMAYWGDIAASDEDSFLAVKTALEIKKRINELKLENAKEGKIIFDVKIGINTGEALLGLAGTDKIMSYTAMGDAVNVASRLESSCSTYKRDILISKSTYDETKDKIVVLEVGKMPVKGKEEPIEVYEPIGFVEGEQEEK